MSNENNNVEANKKEANVNIVNELTGEELEKFIAMQKLVNKRLIKLSLILLVLGIVAVAAGFIMYKGNIDATVMNKGSLVVPLLILGVGAMLISLGVTMLVIRFIQKKKMKQLVRENNLNKLG